MKKILYLFSIIIMIGNSSCGKFLKDGSGDLLVPKSVTHYADLLFGEAYLVDFPTKTAWINLMSDDVDMGPTGNMLPNGGASFDSEVGDGLWSYRWDYSVEEKLTDEAWTMSYESILGCNTVINALPTMTYDETETTLYNSLAASAYALRAYNYFCLVNWYAAPYSKENLSKLGVIIKTLPNVTLEMVERSTIGEVYELINSDIAKAKEHSKLAKILTNKFLISGGAIDLLANRVALFQENWDVVIEEGEKFMKIYNKIFDLKTVDKKLFGIDDESFTMLHLTDNPELLFTFGKAQNVSAVYNFLNWNWGSGLGFTVNKKGDNPLIPLYEEKDLRLVAYYKKDIIDDDEITYTNNYPIKYLGLGANIGYMVNWRNVEVFLNVAEAYARRESTVSSRAIEILNQLRERRYDSGYVNLTPADFATKDDLVKFVWDERRRELSFEETMRWWDMRRQGCKKVLHRYYYNLEQSETYILPEKSNNFTLQIPFSEYGINEVITLNERDNIEKE